MPQPAPLSPAEIAEALAAEAQNRYAGSGPVYTQADGINAHLASLLPRFATNLDQQAAVIQNLEQFVSDQSGLVTALHADLKTIRQLSLPAGYESGDTEIAKLAGAALGRIAEFTDQRQFENAAPGPSGRQI